MQIKKTHNNNKKKHVFYGVTQTKLQTRRNSFLRPPHASSKSDPQEEWSLARVHSHGQSEGKRSERKRPQRRGGLSSGWSLIVSFIWGGLSSTWSLIRVFSYQGGLSSTVVSHLGWFFMVSHQGGLSPGWCSLILDSPASKVPQYKVSLVKTSQEVHKVTRVKLSLNQGTYQNPSLFGTAGSPGTLTEPNLPSRLTGSSSGCPLPAS